jgi:hypothetical protein
MRSNIYREFKYITREVCQSIIYLTLSLTYIINLGCLAQEGITSTAASTSSPTTAQTGCG